MSYEKLDKKINTFEIVLLIISKTIYNMKFLKKVEELPETLNEKTVYYNTQNNNVIIYKKPTPKFIVTYVVNENSETVYQEPTTIPIIFSQVDLNDITSFKINGENKSIDDIIYNQYLGHTYNFKQMGEYTIEYTFKNNIIPRYFLEAYVMPNVKNVTAEDGLELKEWYSFMSNGSDYYTNALEKIEWYSQINAEDQQSFLYLTNATKFTSFKFGNNKKIVDSLFKYAPFGNLTTFELDDNIEEIGNFSLAYSNLSCDLILPKKLKKIGNNAFSELKITKLVCYNELNSIGNAAFSSCSSLTSITYNGTKEQWNLIEKVNNWKGGIPSSCIVHCTDGEISIADA